MIGPRLSWLGCVVLGLGLDVLGLGAMRAEAAEPGEPPAGRETPGDDDAPGERVDPALAGKRERARALVKRGQERAAMGRADDALEAFREALEIYPAYPLAFHELGVTLAEQGELGAAEANLRRALELAPGFARAEQALGEVLRRQRRWDDALAQYRRALDAAPADAPTWYGIASCLRAKKQDAEALWALEQLIALADDAGTPWLAEADKERVALVKAGVVARAWGAPSETAQGPDVPGPGAEAIVAAPGALARHAGDAAFGARRYLAALEAYRAAWDAQAKDAKPDAALAYKIGATYAVMNDAHAALSWWRTSLAADPGREVVAQHLALLVARLRGAETDAQEAGASEVLARARAALRAGDAATALWLARGLDLPGAATVEGEARLRLGDYAGARAIFEEVLGEDPDDRVAKGGLAEVLLRLGQAGPADKAIQAWFGAEGDGGGYKVRAETFLVLRRGEVEARLLAPDEPEE